MAADGSDRPRYFVYRSVGRERNVFLNGGFSRGKYKERTSKNHG